MIKFDKQLSTKYSQVNFSWVFFVSICMLPVQSRTCGRFCLSSAPEVCSVMVWISRRPRSLASHGPSDSTYILGQIVIVRVGASLTSNLVRGPLHSTSTAFTSMFMVREKRITERIHPVAIHFSSFCHAEVVVPAEKLL